MASSTFATRAGVGASFVFVFAISVTYYFWKKYKKDTSDNTEQEKLPPEKGRHGLDNLQKQDSGFPTYSEPGKGNGIESPTKQLKEKTNSDTQPKLPLLSKFQNDIGSNKEELVEEQIVKDSTNMCETFGSRQENKGSGDADLSENKPTEKISERNIPIKDKTSKAVKYNGENSTDDEESNSPVFLSASASLTSHPDSDQMDREVGCNGESRESRDDLNQSQERKESPAKLGVEDQSDKLYENFDSDDSQQENSTLSSEDVTDAILVSQNSPGLMSRSNAQVLVSLLSHGTDLKILKAVLNGIKKSSSFTRNQNLLRECGCIEKIAKLLKRQRRSLRRGVQSSSEIISSVAIAVNNLASNEENIKHFEECVPTLIAVTMENESDDGLCTAALQALTNLSVTTQYHRHYVSFIQCLYLLVDHAGHSTRLQALKVLVNLSVNPELVPHLLAAKAPSCLMDSLKFDSDEAILLRVVSLLANIVTTVTEQQITSASLPYEEKAASPETMFSAIYSVNNLAQMKSHVFLLCQHRDKNVKLQATKIHHAFVNNSKLNFKLNV